MIPAPRRVICAGNIVFDILVRPVDQVKFGTTTWVESIEQHMGGNGANTSYTLARLGVPVALQGMVGNDDFGRMVRQKLQEAGVSVAELLQAHLPTASTAVLVNPSGARAFLHRPGVSREAFLEPLTFKPDQGTHFHLANLFALPGLRSTAVTTMQRAREAGYSTSLDTGWDARGEWLTVLGPVLPLVDLLFVNEDEGRLMSGASDDDRIGDFFLRQGAGSVVLKVGERGCMVFDAGRCVHVPAFSVPVVDTTGAGDCFAGGFLAGLHYGLTVYEAARFANAVGALSIQKLGSTDGVLTYAETREWMAAH